ncbi:MAG: RNA 2'-phosphotransferase [Deltaproteobacteria bacterium]|nr:RNA 2'-phosphotransferase [Deltaproteobacteria bacterium]MBW2116365.1 RNA 2'-phosphotransferase [Deltaproteobacteria bacterium]MBW2342416.1 RNA 2'-phosphotransferase [Deltaproteobacteria bacterium]
MLGHRPYEFGLVPDMDGFVTYKELLQAIHEEPGWHYVRQSHINEVLLSKDRSLFQPTEKHIRVMEIKWQMDRDRPSNILPKILFTPVRRKAHPVVMEKGLKPAEGKNIVLSPDHDMILRIGKRRDQKPVLLEIMAASAQSKDILFYSFGDLFLCPGIPAGFIAGPQVSKEVLESLRAAAEAKKEAAKPKPTDFTPGTFVLDPSKDPDLQRRAKGKKPKGWKEEARKVRKRKRR